MKKAAYNIVAERAGISRASLWKVESGNPAAAIGIYAAVLHAFGNMDKDLALVAKAFMQSSDKKHIMRRD